MKKTVKQLSVLWAFAIAVNPVYAKDTLEIVPLIDIPLTLSTGAVGATIALIRPERFVPVDFKGNRQLINPIDKPFAGIYRPRAASVSDLTVVATILASPIILAFSHNKPNEYLDELLLVTESISLSNFVLQITKTAVSRPRPLMYAEGLSAKERARADNFLSFFSGHASTAFTFATTTTMLTACSDVQKSLKISTATLTLSLATATALLRVAAGKHFPTDIFSGALIGAAASIIVIETHRKKEPEQSPQTENAVTVFTLSLPL